MPCTLTLKAVSIHIDASCSFMSSCGSKLPSDQRNLHNREDKDAGKRSCRFCSDGGGTRLHIVSHESVHPLVMSTNRAYRVSHHKGASQCQVYRIEMCPFIRETSQAYKAPVLPPPGYIYQLPISIISIRARNTKGYSPMTSMYERISTGKSCRKRT
jgi:hypothetical protein